MGWAIHIHLAMQVGVKHGNEAKLFGTGTPPWSVFYMMIYPTMIFRGTTKLDVVIGLIIWGVAIAALWRQRASVPPAAGSARHTPARLPGEPRLLGLASVIPFVLFWAFDAVARHRAGGSSNRERATTTTDEVNESDRSTLSEQHRDELDPVVNGG